MCNLYPVDDKINVNIMRKTFLLLLIFCGSIGAYAQNTEEATDVEKKLAKINVDGWKSKLVLSVTQSEKMLEVVTQYEMGKNIIYKSDTEMDVKNKDLEELGADHPIFSQEYDFPKGLPKIHEHDGSRPQALGIFHENRLVLLFTFESDLGDGWEDPTVHNDPIEVRTKALQMGANIISYAFKN